MTEALRTETLNSTLEPISTKTRNELTRAIDNAKAIANDAYFTHDENGQRLTKQEQSERLSRHFSQFFKPEVANSSNSIDEVTKNAMEIRYQVFSEELGLLAQSDERSETDEFDEFSIPCLIKHVRTQDYAGTLRVIAPETKEQLLPLQKHCLDAITDKELHPSNFPQDTICEVSRVSVPNAFRRRKIDKFEGAETGSINEKTYSTTDLRLFPLIAISLYLTGTAQTLKCGRNHVYIMTEPRLVRSMSMIGIKFKQIGPVIDYNGRRAPYYIDASSIRESLAPGFRKMLDDITLAI